MAKNIMIQGTMSGAGKSLIAAGLCRIFKQEQVFCNPQSAKTRQFLSSSLENF